MGDGSWGRIWIVDFRLIIDDCISPQRTTGLTIEKQKEYSHTEHAEDTEFFSVIN